VPWKWSVSWFESARSERRWLGRLLGWRIGERWGLADEEGWKRGNDPPPSTTNSHTGGSRRGSRVVKVEKERPLFRIGLGTNRVGQSRYHWVHPISTGVPGAPAAAGTGATVRLPGGAAVTSGAAGTRGWRTKRCGGKAISPPDRKWGLIHIIANRRFIASATGHTLLHVAVIKIGVTHYGRLVMGHGGMST